MAYASDAGYVGITILPEFFQTEGPAEAIDNLTTRAGAVAIATSPYVLAPAAEGVGGWEPPADGGVSVRLLDRPLWGKRGLWVEAAPSFLPDASLYRGLRYQPVPATELTYGHGHVVKDAIAAAKARGLEVHLQVQAAIPPGYRVQFGRPLPEDSPMLPDGTVPTRMDGNGSLASPHVRGYLHALLIDLIRHYPQIDAIRIDWPEYPPYSLDALFFDFSPHALSMAKSLSLPIEALRREAQEARRWLREDMREADLDDMFGRGVPGLLQRFPALAALAAFRADIAVDFFAEAAQVVRGASAGRIALIPQSFPPPWDEISGFATARMAPMTPMIGVKLYTMHWPMMLRTYGRWLVEGNPGLRESTRLPATINALFGVNDTAPAAIEDWRYPEFDEPHPVGAAAQAGKIGAARAAAGTTPVVAFAHAYGPIEDVEARLRIAWEASGGRIFVNRYGYLSNAKLDAIGRLERQRPATGGKAAGCENALGR